MANSLVSMKTKMGLFMEVNKFLLLYGRLVDHTGTFAKINVSIFNFYWLLYRISLQLKTNGRHFPKSVG